jgi:hypothetical protein
LDVFPGNCFRGHKERIEMLVDDINGLAAGIAGRTLGAGGRCMSSRRVAIKKILRGVPSVSGTAGRETIMALASIGVAEQDVTCPAVG